MNTNATTKINKLMSIYPNGTVLLASWLREQGYSLDLQKHYKKSHWLESIGTGAMKRYGSDVGYEGAVYALQEQLGLSIHPGAKTALSMLGKAHYIELAQTKAIIFGVKGEILPSWFKNYNWGITIEYYCTQFLPANLGMTNFEFQTYQIKISGAVRAVMECLYLAPDKQDLLECYQIIEGMNNARPNLVQELLESCSSVKVKRLFLYMAEKANHEWFQHLNIKKIDLGKGKRSIVKNGTYIVKYKITVPKELERYV